jgi:hypothetical protein
LAIALQMGLTACDAAPSDAQPPQAASRPAASTGESSPPAPSPNATSTPQAGAPEEPDHYTSLAPADCKVIDTDEEAGGSTSICPGISGYKLRVLDGDARMSIDVIAPDGGRHPLDLWTVASGAFSSLGPRAEWRFAADGGAPTALIVRFEAYEFPEQPERTTSYLLVARLAGEDTCLTARIAPGLSQNLKAREAANRAAGAPCLRPDA